jgi:hypothetical protein
MSDFLFLVCQSDVSSIAIQIAVPVTEAGAHTFVRVSVQAYKASAEVERLVRALL